MSGRAVKVLVALDFDHTVIDGNSDTHICKLAPGGHIPAHLKALYRKDGWTQYMGEVFKLLHSSSVLGDAILACLTEIPLTEGMRDLLTGLPPDQTEFIIISDANSVFIEHILSHMGLRQVFREVHTNPARFTPAGLLQVEMYHRQDWCPLSTKNLCKGHILDTYVRAREQAGVTFSTVAYVGDGTNDFCPGLRLRGGDLLCARRGYSLVDHVPKMQQERGLQLEAELCLWSSGEDILHRLLPLYQRLAPPPLPRPRLRDPSTLTLS